MKKTLLLLLLLTTARAEERLALLIGNSSYAVRPLANPRNDVQLLAKTLRALNFQVEIATDLSKGDLEDTLNRFGDKLTNDSEALVYYAGHAVENKGKTYLLPIGALRSIGHPGQISDRAVSTDYVLEALENTPKLKLLLLDACREEVRSFSLGRGLAPVARTKGSVVVYATTANSTASDGWGQNSPFAASLARWIKEPLPLETVLQKVVADVEDATDHEQSPGYTANGYRGDFYFKKPTGNEAPARSNPAPAETAQAESEAPIDTAPTETAPASTPSNLSEAEQKQILKEANAADDKKDYARVLELYQRLADAGHAEAMEQIGWIYELGEGVAKDYASAQRWYEKAGDAGDSNGYWRIGQLYKEGGPGIEQNYASAKRWFEKAGDAGNSKGYRSIGDLYEKGGPGLEQNYATAKRWFEKAIAAGDSNGYWSIGDLYEEGGPGLEKNYATAKEWFEKAGDAGDRSGYGSIGRLYRKGGPGLEQDLEQACHYYQKADWQSEAEEVCSR